MDLSSILLPELELDDGGSMNEKYKIRQPKGDTPQVDNSINYETDGSGKAPTVARRLVQAQDHVLAERRRREKMNGQFISMSALLPNLKKMDKASVLEDATNYIRELQDRVKVLEGLTEFKIKDAKKSSITLKRSSLSNDDENDSSSHQTNSEDVSDDVPCDSSAEIKVQMSGSNVLVKIQSQQNSSLLVKVLIKMQKLGLSIISSAFMPFADTVTLITIVAQAEDGLYLTAADLVRNLQLSLCTSV